MVFDPFDFGDFDFGGFDAGGFLGGGSDLAGFGGDFDFGSLSNADISRILRLDPAGFGDPFGGVEGGPFERSDTTFFASPAPSGTGTDTDGSPLLSKKTAQILGLGITTAATGLGLVGILQKALGGDAVSRVKVERAIEAASPEERQVFAQALQGLKQSQDFAGPLGQQLQGMAGLDQGAILGSLGGLSRQAGTLESLLYGGGPGPEFGPIGEGKQIDQLKVGDQYLGGTVTSVGPDGSVAITRPDGTGAFVSASSTGGGLPSAGGGLPGGAGLSTSGPLLQLDPKTGQLQSRLPDFGALPTEMLGAGSENVTTGYLQWLQNNYPGQSPSNRALRELYTRSTGLGAGQGDPRNTPGGQSFNPLGAVEGLSTDPNDLQARQAYTDATGRGALAGDRNSDKDAGGGFTQDYLNWLKTQATPPRGAEGPFSIDALRKQVVPGQVPSQVVPGQDPGFLGQGPGLLGQIYGGASGILGQQGGILGALAGPASGLARGELNITPELNAMVDKAYQTRGGDIIQQAMENARSRGFAGGKELVYGAGSPVAAPMFADLQSQMANSKLNLAQQLPQLAANIAGAYSTPGALRFSAANQLQNLNQNLLSAIGDIGQRGIQNRINFLGARSGLINAASGLGNVQQGGRLGAGGTNTTTRNPSSLLDAFAPLASLLSGTGQSLAGLGMLSGVR